MFADSLLDSQWGNRSHRGWTTLASFALQAAGVAALLLLPLLYTQGFLPLQPHGEIVAPMPQLEPAAERATASAPGLSVVSEVHGLALQAPQHVPDRISMDPDAGLPPTVNFGGGSGANTCGRACQGVPSSIGTGPAVIPPPPSVPPVRQRTSVMMEGSLIHRVEPQYPALAKTMGIQGTVVLAAVVSREGTIEKLKVVSGQPFLAQAAAEAVRQWRYRPYVLNGEPVEVDTQITVNFFLSR
jgi:periplasmic protein TonB